jgi:arylsulfatase A-like enzyme
LIARTARQPLLPTVRFLFTPSFRSRYKGLVTAIKTEGARLVTRPNILYLHSHDTGRYIQPYGHAVPTPHMQKLAEEGILFRKAFCAGPTCSPSRAALLTGASPHSCGMTGLAHRGWSLND